ncbi:MAG: (2Fe-2S) ferredoxin domain-containing protein [Thermomicrobiales bacterium]|nr:(2Fe-2S) ferredoxin domain-containing protein [Thermomicrobiales bacterium]
MATEGPIGASAAPAQWRVHLCTGPNCTARGSRELFPALEAALRRAGIAERVEVIACTCRDRCDYGPSMNVYPGPVFYNELTPAALDEIVERHLKGGDVVERWLFHPRRRQRAGCGGAIVSRREGAW